MWTIEIITYAFTLWLALYLLRRSGQDLRLRYAGLGLLSYSVAIALNALLAIADDGAMQVSLRRTQRALLYIPAVFWLGAIVALLPEEHLWRTRYDVFWRYGLPWMAVVVFLLGLLLETPTGYLSLAVIIGCLLFGSLIVTIVSLRQSLNRQAKEDSLTVLWPIALTITLFFVLGAGLLLLPFEISWLPRSWLILAISGDLEVLSVLILRLDAYEQGERWFPDALRSMLTTGVLALLLGGQVAFFLMMSEDTSFAWGTLLIIVLATIIVWQTYGNAIDRLVDQVAYAGTPDIQKDRAELRAAEQLAGRRNDALEMTKMSETEFARLTRRALSHMSDLPKLAASPLTNLPLIEKRIKRQHHDNGDEAKQPPETLQRATELRAILTESIRRLKPRSDADFAPTDEWRYYNAVYFPYVVGLKPYSRRALREHLTPTEQEALDWFQIQVPERTLYNWQKKAADLIARDLRERVANLD